MAHPDESSRAQARAAKDAVFELGKSLAGESETKQKELLERAEDDMFRHTCYGFSLMHCVCAYGAGLEIMQYACERTAHIKGDTKARVLLSRPDTTGETPFHFAGGNTRLTLESYRWMREVCGAEALMKRDSRHSLFLHHLANTFTERVLSLSEREELSNIFREVFAEQPDCFEHQALDYPWEGMTPRNLLSKTGHGQALLRELGTSTEIICEPEQQSETAATSTSAPSAAGGS